MSTATLPSTVEPTAETLRSRPGTPTWEIAELYPNQGDWSEAEYLAMRTNRLIEFTDGCLEFLTMPTPFHQFIVEFLFEQLKAFVTARRLGGKVCFAPLRIRVRSGKYREPDVLYLRPERIQDVRQPPTGADLVMEVVSDDTNSRERDLITKRTDYAEAGIQEYWIIDPDTHSITVLVLEGAAYRVHGNFPMGAVAQSVLLPGFEIDVSAALAAGQGCSAN